MNTAKENIAKCPERCFAVNEVERSIVSIRAGETGYHPEDTEYELAQLRRLFDFAKPDTFETSLTGGTFNAEIEWLEKAVDLLNRELFGVTPAQRHAMKWGSMFGWENNAANPDYYATEPKSKLIK